MALCFIRRRNELGEGIVLSPERHDPRRESLVASSGETALGNLGEVAQSVRESVNPRHDDGEALTFLVLDTSDVHEGVIVGRREPRSLDSIGSTKKRMKQGDVIISRLRPYLRQVAFVDGNVQGLDQGTVLVGSTEFFVLRSLDERSIAFLVPYLLSDPVQGVLSASQEGGHHPRFTEKTLLELPVPREVLGNRDQISESVERSIGLFREAETSILGHISEIGQSLGRRG